jgi:cell division protease FtsH
MARNMVTKWGLSETMGPLMYDEGGEEVFLGRSAAQPAKAMSDETARSIDKEVRRIIDECYTKAHQLLEEHRDKLDMMADALMQYETIDAEQINDIMDGKTPAPPADWSGNDGGRPSGGSPVDDTSAEARGPIGGPASEH